jgi:hypothetical protein
MRAPRPTTMPLLVGMVAFCSIAHGYQDQVVLTMGRQQLALLGQLRQEWLDERSAASGDRRALRRPDPSPLVGVLRAAVTSRLGRPDLCLPIPNSCGDARHWTYFFYRRQPPAFRSAGSGITEVKISAGGGWALELQFSKNGAIEKASWVKQE